MSPSPEAPDKAQADRLKNMTAMDRLPASVRALIHDFGFVIVRDMWNDGHRNAVTLREELETWRERRQAQWLAEIPYPRQGH